MNLVDCHGRKVVKKQSKYGYDNEEDYNNGYVQRSVEGHTLRDNEKLRLDILLREVWWS